MKKLVITILFAITVLVEGQAQEAPFGVNTVFDIETKIEGGNFEGTAWVKRLFAADDFSNSAIGNVTFEPGSRSNWHKHPAGQMLLALDGIGYYQQRGEPVLILNKGDFVKCPPNVEHWHGASHNGWFVQLAVTTEHPDGRVIWLDPVTEDEYSAGKQLLKIGSSQTLSIRHQHIVLIASITAKGDLERLKPILNDALDAGLSVNEVKEVLVHLYAYCGFPRSIQGLITFLSVVEERKAEGIEDVIGKVATPIDQKLEKFERGEAVLSELTGLHQNPPTSGYRAFSPEMDVFLKEHLFADIFERDILSYQDREITTLAALNGLGGVDRMISGHMRIAMNIGIKASEVSDLLSIIENQFGKSQARAGRLILGEILENR